MTQSQKKQKSYPLHDSPFYLLKSKKRLEKILFISWEALDKLLSCKQDLYTKKEEDKRQLQTPKNKLKILHKRIANLLVRIQTPDYLQSKKKCSYMSNAYIHCNTKNMSKTDIKKFFPSTSFSMVYKMFLQEFHCAQDIAQRLADICCFKDNENDKQFIPTGSHLSGIVTFFSAKKMFDEIERLVIANNCILSVFVDDITISGDKAKLELYLKIRNIINKHGYRVARKKTKFYTANQTKITTGIAITPEQKLAPPHERYKKIREAEKQYNQTKDPKTLRSLMGRKSEVKRILTFQKSK